MNKLFETYFSLVNKFFPEKTRRPAIGLDIGSSSCKIVELTSQEHPREILNWAVEPFGNSSQTEVIKKLLTRFDLSQKNVYTAVSGQGTLIRYVTMPRMSLADLKKSFILEADKYFPFPKDTIYTDCSILDPKGKENKMSVLVAAARKEIIDQRIQLMSNVGVPVHFIGLTTVALANAFAVLKPRAEAVPANSPAENSSETVAIIEIGDVNSGILILCNRLPRFTRTMSWGGRELSKRISNTFGISLEEAERMKINPLDKLENVRSACEPLLMNLVSEIRLSFDYFVTENNSPITRIFLAGGSSRLAGIEKFLTGNLEVPVEVWDPVKFLKPATKISIEDLNKNIHSLTVALGLALQDND